MKLSSDYFGDCLTIEYHVAQEESLLNQRRTDFTRDQKIRLLNLHASYVQQAIQYVSIDVATKSENFTSTESLNYFKYGCGRRLGMMTRSFRLIRSLAPPERWAPLKQDESHDLEIHLNMVYINILGALDNLARAIIHELGTDSDKLLSPSQMGLFKKAFRNRHSLVKYGNLLSHYREWYGSLVSRRDPAAHRIPLYIPPSYLDQNQANKFQAKHEEWASYISEKDFEEADRIWNELNQIGTFSASFAHDPEDGVMSLHPTLAEDIGCCANIINSIVDTLSDSNRGIY